ncbi:class A beta-lactamase [Photobacterium sp. CCB-ST2H9]|uniref:class A beta-lactamase n=1 Tax=Photobacterium sp. CCB-ST2H9 TaxID=2912855 RepID=UPI002003109D|nr:class A beta-lactamase [Photobacterium sp. CCB-ST2H9]UTM60182.1 class A beta-lactamase [Photobacterium sp. CCB-ST2H9]
MKNTCLFIGLMLFAPLTFSSTLEETISSIEQRTSGQIGVSVLDTQNKQTWDYKGNERFPMMSTFKTLACAKMLYDAEQGHLDKSTSVAVDADQLITWSPATEKLAGSTITIEKACEATMLTSDNTAANLVLQQIGGPQGVTKFLREIGDNSTQLDRIEPLLNQAEAGDLRDTTTPNAMVKALNTLLFGTVLSEHSTAQLQRWMQNNQVSDPLLRSVLPKGWFIADRSGAGGHGSRGITAIVWNPTREPVIISIYLTQSSLEMSERNQVIAEIGQGILKAYRIQ